MVSAVDKRHGVCLIMLNILAAFDTVDRQHPSQPSYREYVWLDGSAINLFESYILSKRTQCVSVEGVLSELSELVYGIPQGSVLGPTEICIYTDSSWSYFKTLLTTVYIR